MLGGVDAGPVHGDIELGEGVEQAGVLLGAGLPQGRGRWAGVLAEDDHSVDEEQPRQLLRTVECHGADAGLTLSVASPSPGAGGKLRPGTHPQCVEAAGQWPASDGGTRLGRWCNARPRHRHLRLMLGDTILDIPCSD